jgi:hypothetical protein
MLPTGPADLLTRVLVQGVVDHPKDLDPFSNERFHQLSEEEVGDKVSVPSSLPQETVDGGKMLGLMEPHRQNHLTDGVLANGQHPTRQERYEDTETRGTETVPKMNLVNPEWIWYVSVHLGVPPSRLLTFTKPGMAGTPYFFNCSFTIRL